MGPILVIIYEKVIKLERPPGNGTGFVQIQAENEADDEAANSQESSDDAGDSPDFLRLISGLCKISQILHRVVKFQRILFEKQSLWLQFTRGQRCGDCNDLILHQLRQVIADQEFGIDRITDGELSNLDLHRLNHTDTDKITRRLVDIHITKFVMILKNLIQHIVQYDIKYLKNFKNFNRFGEKQFNSIVDLAQRIDKRRKIHTLDDATSFVQIQADNAGESGHDEDEGEEEEAEEAHQEQQQQQEEIEAESESDNNSDDEGDQPSLEVMCWMARVDQMLHQAKNFHRAIFKLQSLWLQFARAQKCSDCNDRIFHHLKQMMADHAFGIHHLTDVERRVHWTRMNLYSLLLSNTSLLMRGLVHLRSAEFAIVAQQIFQRMVLGGGSVPAHYTSSFYSQLNSILDLAQRMEARRVASSLC